MATMNKIRELLISLIHLPNAPELSPQVVKEFHGVLGHWDDDLLDTAVLHYKSAETFFPTPGTLNGRVLDLQLIAMGVPTAGEAWSQVLDAIRYTSAVYCDEGLKLRQDCHELQNGNYMSAVAKYGSHVDSCDTCAAGGYGEFYAHPAVAETVRLLGGRDALFTDNPAADRKQFIDAYRERLQIEGRKFIMPPAVKDYISSQSPALLSMGKLTKRLEAK